jgi:anti-anti-sigma factor
MLPPDPGAVTLAAEDLLRDPPVWRCRVEPSGGGGRLVAEGELDLAVIDVLEELARTLPIDAGAIVVVDLSAVDFVDSSVVAFMLRLLRRVEERSGRITVMVQWDGAAHRTLQVTGACDALGVVPGE